MVIFGAGSNSHQNKAVSSETDSPPALKGHYMEINREVKDEKGLIFIFGFIRFRTFLL